MLLVPMPEIIEHALCIAQCPISLAAMEIDSSLPATIVVIDNSLKDHESDQNKNTPDDKGHNTSISP
jgi:hypothetical protein